YARAGRREALVALVARTERELGRAKVDVGGHEAVLVDYLRDELSRVAPAAAASTDPAGEGEQFAGSPDGVRVVDPAEPAQRHWAAPLPQAAFSEAEEPFGTRGLARPLALSPNYRPVIPAVSDGIVFLHTEYTVSAYNLFSTGAEPLWSHALAPPPEGS